MELIIVANKRANIDIRQLDVKTLKGFDIYRQTEDLEVKLIEADHLQTMLCIYEDGIPLNGEKWCTRAKEALEKKQTVYL
jgi:hypothetical protein